MAKKVNYDGFNSFDLNEACDHFDCVDQKLWAKIRPFIVADCQDYEAVMVENFDFEEVSDSEHEAFVAGVKYALTKMNIAFEKAGVELEVAEADLGEGYGYMLVRTDDEPEDFVKRALKKPVMMVEGWV
jgi:hypothetical protein